MNLILTIIIVLAIIIIGWYIFHNLYKTGQLPKGFMRTSYERMLGKANKQYDKYMTEPEKLYTKITGHVDNDVAKTAYKKAINKEALFTMDEKQGKAATSKSVTNAFIIANMNEHIYDNHNLADRYYNRTIDRIIDNTDMIVAENDADNDAPTVEHMVDVAARYTPPKAKVAKVAIAKSRRQRGDYYKPRRITNDPQNVHQSVIVSSYVNRYNKIKNSSYPTNDIIQTLKDKDAIKIYKDADTKHPVAYYDVTEKEIYDKIWARINNVENNSNKDALISAFVEALSSSFEKDAYGKKAKVCTTGRVSRALDCLTLLDADPEISKPIMSNDMIRNEIFAKTSKILETELDKQSDEFKQKYNNGEEDEEVKEFIRGVYKQIDEIKKDYSYLSGQKINDYLEEAKVGV